ncbi:MAG: DOPA 4,5-dioxygenase family protein [Alphaproteobacteria bacterium]
MNDPASITDTISGYHAHIYFRDESERARALALRDKLEAGFEVRLGRVWDKPVGPHPIPMYQIAFAAGQFAAVVPFLMLARDGLSVLVHPETGDDLADHSAHALWLGAALPLDLDILRRLTGG